MEEVKVEHTCPECEAKAEAHKKSEEMGMAILVALMPLMTITFLSNVGLF
jgi:hypothetical protein